MTNERLMNEWSMLEAEADSDMKEAWECITKLNTVAYANQRKQLDDMVKAGELAMNVIRLRTRQMDIVREAK